MKKVGSAIVLVMFLVCIRSAIGEPRILQYRWSVGEEWSDTFSQDTDWHMDSPKGSGSSHIQCTIKFNVIGTNEEKSSNIQMIQTNGIMTVGHGIVTNNVSSGIDMLKAHSDRGVMVGNINAGASNLFPSLSENWNYGKEEDVTGYFTKNAVDVGDEWIQVFKVTLPYGQSATNMEISCRLMEWTTVNGHTNVAKIIRKYTRPVYGMKDICTVVGSLACVDYAWFAADEGKEIKCEGTGSGTLTYNGNLNLHLSFTNHFSPQK